MNNHQVDEQDLRTMLISSFRYALGRMSYIVSDTVDIIIEHQEVLKYHDKLLMVGEIRTAVEQGRAGMDMDKECWLSLVEELSK